MKILWSALLHRATIKTKARFGRLVGVGPILYGSRARSLLVPRHNATKHTLPSSRATAYLNLTGPQDSMHWTTCFLTLLITNTRTF